MAFPPNTGLSLEQAERIREEAIFQGWTNPDDTGLTAGRVDLMQYYDIEAEQNTGRYWIDLKLPGSLGPEYRIRSTDEWRRLKAKVDEIKQIIDEVSQRGWDANFEPKKTGPLAMAIEVYPPGTRRPYGKRVGGMRTWKKIVADVEENIIDGAQPARALSGGVHTSDVIV